MAEVFSAVKKRTFCGDFTVLRLNFWRFSVLTIMENDAKMGAKNSKLQSFSKEPRKANDGLRKKRVFSPHSTLTDPRGRGGFLYPNFS